MGIARGWEKRVIRTNVTYAKRTVRIFSVSPQSRSLFSASFQTFCLTARTYLNTQKYGLFCSLRTVGFFLSPHTPYGRVRLARFARVRLLRHALPISLLILRKKTTVLQSTYSDITFRHLGLRAAPKRGWTGMPALEGLYIQGL